MEDDSTIYYFSGLRPTERIVMGRFAPSTDSTTGRFALLRGRDWLEWRWRSSDDDDDDGRRRQRRRGQIEFEYRSLLSNR